MKHNYIPEIKKALEEKDEALLNLFYIIEDNCIVDTTELSDLIDLCQFYEVPLGFTLLDILSGKVDADIIKMLDIKMFVDSDVASLPTSKEKKKNKNKEKVVQFKNKMDKENI